MALAQLPTGMALVCGCNHGGLAVARSLGRRGVRVAAVTANPAEAGLRSRYLKETAICPDPVDPAAFARFLLDHADRWRGAMLFETNDVYATAIAEFRDELAEHYRIAAPAQEIVELFLEKNRTYELAARVGVPFPSLIQPRTIAELDEAIGDIRFPVMVKPVRSHEFAARYGRKLVVVEEPVELRAHVMEALQAGIEVMVCEIVPGSDYRTLHKLWLYINESGSVLAEVHNVKLRQTPPMFGISRVAATIPPNAEMRELAMQIIEASGLTGTAGFEFKLDPRDGRLKLIEVNVRMMADVQLMISAGVDIPWIMYQHVVHGISAPPPTYRNDQMWIYLVPDVRRFVTDRDPPSVRAFLEPYLSRHRSYAYWSWRDPKPFGTQIAGKIQRAWARRRGQQPDDRGLSDTDVL